MSIVVVGRDENRSLIIMIIVLYRDIKSYKLISSGLLSRLIGYVYGLELERLWGHAAFIYGYDFIR